MIIISIDVETTGLDLEQCSLLEFSAIVEDTCNIKPLEELPSFSCYIDTGRLITGSAFALNMNKNILELLAKQEKLNGEELKDFRLKNSILNIEDVASSFYSFLQVHNVINPFSDEKGSGLSKEWIDSNGHRHMVSVFTNKSKHIHLNILGKNFGTFDRVFIENIPRWKQMFRIRRRIADPSILLTDWKNDEALPNFQTCMERSGIDGEVSHTAYDDAKDTLHMLRFATNNYSSNKQFTTLKFPTEEEIDNESEEELNKTESVDWNDLKSIYKNAVNWARKYITENNQ